MTNAPPRDSVLRRTMTGMGFGDSRLLEMSRSGAHALGGTEGLILARHHVTLLAVGSSHEVPLEPLPSRHFPTSDVSAPQPIVNPKDHLQ